MNPYLISDLLDLPLEKCPPDITITHQTVKHNLSLNYTWKCLFGIPISKNDIYEYLEGNLTSSSNVDRQKLIEFIGKTRRFPQRQCPTTIREYEKSLSDEANLTKEIILKLVERYDKPITSFNDKTLDEIYVEILGDTPESFFQKEKSLIDRRKVETLNPVTQHFIPKSEWVCNGCVGYLDSVRSIISRDFLFINQASISPCIYFDTISTKAHITNTILDEMVKSSNHPITIMSNNRKFLHQKRDFFFYANFVDDDAYKCIPRVFTSFVLIGNSQLPKRPPLSKNLPKCYYYSVDSQDPESPTNTYYKLYVLITESMKTCNSTQLLTKSIAYICPQFVESKDSENFEIEFGVHRDSSATFPSAQVVDPSEAWKCKVYYNLNSIDGIWECMSGGGVPVVSQVSDGLFDGFNCIVHSQGTHASYSKEIGENARLSTNILRSEDTFRWIWSQFIKKQCPVKANTPKTAELLNTRFIMLYMIVYLRKALEYKVVKAAPNSVIVLDNRKDTGTIMSLLVTLTNLDAGWNVIFFCTDNNLDFVTRLLPTVNTIKMQNYPKRGFFIEQYNRLMKTSAFWRGVQAQKCLLIQNDGTLVRPGLEKHKVFEYDYAGAPWRNHPYLYEATKGNFVGNGGLTLRNPRECATTCDKHAIERLQVYNMCPIMSEAEDVFFSRRMTKVAPFDVAHEFSMEQHTSPNALGYHRFWVYHPVEFTTQFYEKVLREAFDRAQSNS